MAENNSPTENEKASQLENLKEQQRQFTKEFLEEQEKQQQNKKVILSPEELRNIQLELKENTILIGNKVVPITDGLVPSILNPEHLVPIEVAKIQYEMLDNKELKVESNENKIVEEEIILAYPTSHLNHFELIKNLTSIESADYVPIHKAMWYYQHSKLLSETIVELGKIYTDLRLHIALPIFAGGGKSAFKHQSKTISRLASLKSWSPTSRHPEQYVGKTIKERIKEKGLPARTEYKEILGYMAGDEIIHDEALDLYCSDERTDEEIRAYLRQGKDVYGRNEIIKKMVDIEDEKAIKYCPHFVTLDLLQNTKIPADLVIKGDFRRSIYPYVRFKSVNRIAELRDRVLNETQQDYSPLIKHIQQVKALNGTKFTLKPEAKECFLKLHKELILQGKSHSLKGNMFTTSLEFFLQDVFLKFCCIYSASKYTNIIDDECIEKAYIDFCEIWNGCLNYIADKVVGLSEYGIDIREVTSDEIEFLNRCHLSTESMSVDSMLKNIQNDRGVSFRQAQRILKKWKELGILKYSKSKYMSKLELNKEYKYNIVINTYTYSTYFEIFSKWFLDVANVTSEIHSIRPIGNEGIKNISEFEDVANVTSRKKEGEIDLQRPDFEKKGDVTSDVTSEIACHLSNSTSPLKKFDFEGESLSQRILAYLDINNKASEEDIIKELSLDFKEQDIKNKLIILNTKGILLYLNGLYKLNK